MRSYPTNEQMNLGFPESIFTNHPIGHSRNVENHQATTFAQNIGRPKCFLYIGRDRPICKFDGR